GGPGARLRRSRGRDAGRVQRHACHGVRTFTAACGPRRVGGRPPARGRVGTTRRRRNDRAAPRGRGTHVGRIVISENVTLAAVVQDPAGDEGFRLGGWAGLIKDSPELNQLALDEALGAAAWLLGRRSYEWFAARWPARTGPLADRLNGMP